MYSMILSILMIASLATNSTGLIENFNMKVNGFYQVKPAEEKAAVADWQAEANPLGALGKGKDFSTDAKAAYALDLSNGQVMHKKNENGRLQVASLTKMMTAYIILKEQPLDKEVLVPPYAVRSDDSLAGIKPGETLKIRDLLKGLLINSGSDAAQALAITDAGSNDAFAKKMNEAALGLNLKNTHFDNPVGWDSANNYSSAKDLSILARVLLNNKFFAETVAKKYASIATKGGRTINLVNTNLLLNGKDIIGVKTGYTITAGECLVDLKTFGNHRFLTVVIGSNDRFGQTRSFLDWIQSRFLW